MDGAKFNKLIHGIRCNRLPSYEEWASLPKKGKAALLYLYAIYPNIVDSIQLLDIIESSSFLKLKDSELDILFAKAKEIKETEDYLSKKRKHWR